MDSLQAMASQLLKLEDETKADPLRFAVFTPPQEKFLRSRAKFFLLRGGNQVGKSYVGAAETIWRCIGGHPYKPTKPPPITAWIVCHSWSQSLVIQEKVHALIPPGELHPDMEFVRGKGFRGTGSPVVRFKNGSIIRFRTTQQSSAGRGTVALASGTVDWIWVDEPPPPQAWSEIAARVLRTRGSVGITMTPVGVPVDYLKKMCEDGQIVDIPAPLNLANVTPAGCRPLLTQAEIDQMANSYLKFDRAVRMEGSWEGFTPDGVIFESFRDEMISDVRPRGGEWRMAVGIDHGSGEASQCAVLVAIQIPDPRKKRGDGNDYYTYVIDEYTSGAADAEIHARGILAMLRRNRLEPKDIYRWTGDRSHGGDRYGGRMSNTMLRSAFEHVLGYPRGRGFRIHTAYKPSYSVYYGCRVIHEAMSRGRFQIHPRCKTSIKSLKNWALTKQGRMDNMSQHKHLIDALRYAIMPVVDVQYRAPRASKIKLVR